MSATASRLLFTAALLAAASACSVDPAANTARRCDEQTPCGAGQDCFRGFCVPGDPPGNDGGPRDGGEGDAGPEECDETVTATRSCYGYDLATLGRGECRAGYQVCDNGRFTTNCVDDRGPGPEIQCSGRDERCNGDDDEIPAGSCNTGLLGICAEGTMQCVGLEARCVQTRTATVETCNGEDDDCNGVPDDQPVECYPAATDGCQDRGDGTYRCAGTCRAGTQVCGGACAGAVTPAGIDGCTVSSTVALDDDCDGQVDEDCACRLGETRSCYQGPPDTLGVGVCRTGTVTCVDVGNGDFRFGACMGDRIPTAETCANEGADDDCNGTPDDGVPGRGEACTTMDRGICGMGFQQCVGGQMVCVTPPAAPAELCNGLDDDCDGAVDETFDFDSTATCRTCNNACGPGEACCADGCVDQGSDERHCGRCGNACAVGQTCCGGACVDTSTDVNNCGACGAPPCGAGQVCCGGACTNLEGDGANCGMCGRTCTGNQLCCGGNCLAPNQPACTGCAEACNAPEICCAPTVRVCSNPMEDEQRCGGCNNAPCPPDSLCCGGTCVPRSNQQCSSCTQGCGPGTLCCGGQCVINGPNNCNACGTTCTAAAPSCCGVGCVNLQRDPQNCMGCGTVCSGATPNCCGGCVNSMTDSQNCGPTCQNCEVLLGLLGRCVNGQCRL